MYRLLLAGCDPRSFSTRNEAEASARRVSAEVRETVYVTWLDTDGYEEQVSAWERGSERVSAGCVGDARGDGYPGSRFFHKSPDCMGHYS